MDTQEKIVLLEEMLELEIGSLNLETRLEDLEEWDSMASLSLIVIMDENFNKKLSGKQIKDFKTVKSIIDFME